MDEPGLRDDEASGLIDAREVDSGIAGVDDDDGDDSGLTEVEVPGLVGKEVSGLTDVALTGRDEGVGDAVISLYLDSKADADSICEPELDLMDEVGVIGFCSLTSSSLVM